MIRLKQLTVLAFLIALVACNDEVLLQDLDQRDATAILVMLAQNGVEAKKMAVERQQQVSWSIMVSRDDESRARQLLIANNLPRKRELGLSGICKEAGMIPTPKTEKCREMLAIKGEVINSLVSIPGVVDADVVINLPDKEDFPDEDTPPERPRASVVIQINPKEVSDGVITESKIQRFVSNSVTGMDLRDVTVIISRVRSGRFGLTEDPKDIQPAAKPSLPSKTESLNSETSDLVQLAGLQMTEASAKKLKIVLIIFLSIFLLLSAAIIFILIRLVKERNKSVSADEMDFESNETPALPEKQVVDQLVEEAGQANEK